MAAVSLDQQYLQMGPRQGVYICSHSIRWRPAQFRSPAESYRFRERINPTTPTGATQNSVVQRPFSASSTRASNPRPLLSTPVPRSTTSYSNGASRKPCTRVTTANKKMQDTHSRSESSELSLTAKALSIQPRPSRRSHMSSVTNSDRVMAEQPFSYPDPYKIQGDPTFSVRIAELTRLECDTLKYEDWKKRTSMSKWSANHPPGTLSRSMSARGYRSTTLKANISTSVEGGRKSLLSRKSSLPATFNSMTTTVPTQHSQSPSVKSCSTECSTISPSMPPPPTDNSGLLPLKPTRDASSQTCCLASDTSEDSEMEEEGWQSGDVSCEDTDSCIELQSENDLKVTSVLERSVNLLHLHQEKEAMNSIPEQQGDTCPASVKDGNSDKTGHTEHSTTDVACRKKPKRRGGSCKKKNSKMRSHSTPGLDHMPTVHSSSSTCSLKSTKIHVHRKKVAV